MNRMLLICENESRFKEIKKELDKDAVIMLSHPIDSFKFDYSNNKVKEEAFTDKTPVYKENATNVKERYCVYNKDGDLNELEFGNVINLHNETVTENIRIEGIKFLNNFSEIVFACENDLTGVRSFDFIFRFSFLLGDDWLNILKEMGIKVNFIGSDIEDEDYNTLVNNYHDRKKIEESDFNKLQESFMKKDFFEYNYNLNAYLYFNMALLRSGYNPIRSFVLTRNYIATLNIIKKENLRTLPLIKLMETKKIGSLSSRNLIIKNLEKVSLITQDKNEDSVLKLTKKGRDFLTYLHEFIADENLNKDLISDSNSLEEFKLKYGKYLEKVFKSQSNFLK